MTNKVMLHREGRDLREGVLAEYRAGGIVRRIEDKHLGAVVDVRGDFGDVRLKMIFLFEEERNGGAAQSASERRINGEARIGVQHFVPGSISAIIARARAILQPGATSTCSGARSRRRVRLKYAAMASRKAGMPRWRDVAVAAIRHRGADRVHDRRRRMKVGFAEFEMDDRTAFFFEFFGAREDRQRAFAIEL